MSNIEIVQATTTDPLVSSYVEEAYTSPPLDGIIDNADFSKTIELSDGKKLTLRDLRAKDLLAVERAQLFGNLERTFRLAQLLTIEYGTEAKITEVELGDLKGKDFLKLAGLIASFLE